jgi:hypothetical protein
MHRWKLARAPMPFWRVVVEAKPNLSARAWPETLECAVVAIYVWARTIEEAEGLAALALEEQGFRSITADAVKHPPVARPRRQPAAVARGPYGFLKHGETPASRARAPNIDLD